MSEPEPDFTPPPRNTWGIVATDPFRNFSSQDLEDRILTYIVNNWVLQEDEDSEIPVDLEKNNLFNLSIEHPNPSNEPFRFNQNYWIWIESRREQATRDADQGSTIGLTGWIKHTGTFWIHLYARRFERQLTFPELGILQEEVQRILFQYTLTRTTSNKIPGVVQFDNWDVGPVGEVTSTGESTGGYMYRKTCQIQCWYYRTSTPEAFLDVS